MDWIFENFQIVALIAVVIGSLVKHVLETKAAESRDRDDLPEGGDMFDPGEDWPIPQPQPKPSVPPPLVRQAPPLPAEGPPRHSREHEMEIVLKRQQDMQERIRQIKESKTTTTGGAAATSARVAAAQSRPKAPKAAKTGLRGALRNPQEIRRAIVMREILGPPLGLR